jgi:DNA polymerase
MLVGEAPGADEDRTGRPFVGRCGKLLDRSLAQAGLNRGDIFITSVVK